MNKQSINSFYSDEIIDNDIIHDVNNNMLIPNLNLAEPSKSIYLSEDIFVKYFDVILFKNLYSLNSLNICPFKSVYITDYFIILDFVNFTYKIPETLHESIKKCKSSNTRFYIIPLRLNLNYKSAHSNLVIIDNQSATIEFFEPHGNKFNGTEYELPYNIEQHIKILVIKLFPISTFYTFKNVQNSCPRGLQAKQNSINSNSGHCLAWSLLFIHLRILNLIHDTSYIIDYLHRNSDIDLDFYIRRYIGYLENTSYLLKKKLYPTLKYNMLLSQSELDNIRNRIKYLLVNYTDLSLTVNKTPLDFIEINKIFEELISYHKIQNFSSIFFKYFNRYALNDINNEISGETNISNDSDYSDVSEVIQDPKREKLPEELNLENLSYDITKKRKASNSPKISEFSDISNISEDSEDSNLDELYSNYN